MDPCPCGSGLAREYGFTFNDDVG
ncbi:hypothetical protein [Pseudomonas sp. BS3782 TE3695]